MPLSREGLLAVLSEHCRAHALRHTSSHRNDVKRSFHGSVQNLLIWALTSPNRGIDELIH